ncbi:hypothetical protein DEO72_LG9g918 [Vigna unguiculata]|uniref:Uncharacterized protein n=1 Tax=Vigna unguiculata TaxID=3917 RepID=A0A4D6N0D9_VIGUN|nr:hypothetical protein DEO72_LG9g918 [Vigna unguiculata]
MCSRYSARFCFPVSDQFAQSSFLLISYCVSWLVSKYCASLFQVRAVAKSDNLAQASLSRLGETSRVRNSLGSLGEILRVVLQWSGHNPMAPVSGCPWWCPICITRRPEIH